MTETTQQRRRVDWDAVERDYRTTQMTLRELGDKHGCDHAAVARKAKKLGWQRDLTEAVRAATNARVIESVVNSAVTSGQQTVTNAISVAAEVNTRVVLGHRRRIADLHRLAEEAQAKLESMGETLADVREAGVYVQAVGGLATITKTLIEQERKAFGLDDDGKKTDDAVDDLIRRLND